MTLVKKCYTDDIIAITMAGIKDQKKLDELRKQLYARNAKPVKIERHQLKRDSKENIPQSWQADDASKSARSKAREDLRQNAATTDEKNGPANTEKDQASQDKPTPQRRYRRWILVSSFLVFLVGIGFSSFYLFFGLNEISGKNISVSASAPRSLGAGEVIPLQYSIANDNQVPVVSGTLVVNYPVGTRDSEDPTKSVTTARIPIERIEPGSVLQVPAEAVVFGEVDEQKEISARLEYRVEGTNSTLEKQTDTLDFTITSSPLVLEVESIEKAVAGQEFDITLTVRSNSPTSLSNVLVSAQYPGTFDFSGSSESPVFGNDTWQFDEIEPNESREIVITGILTGEESQEFTLDAEVGVPRADNRFILDSIYATAQHEFVLEKPFIQIASSINSKSEEEVVVASSRDTNFSINLTNTLDNSIYDVRTVVRLNGNALDVNEVKVSDGFYNSNDNTVQFDVTTESSLERVTPGDNRRFSFSLTPRQVATGEVSARIDIYARRADEADTQEQLLGSSVISALYESVPTLDNRIALHDGVVPPEVGTESEYDITLVAEAGKNDLVDAEVTASLPTYVEWLDDYSGPGDLQYNEINKTLTWSIGSISAEDVAELDLRVAFRPSASQSGRTPVLINSQQFRATDRFTGTLIRTEASAVSTELPSSEGYDRGNGEVAN